MSVINIGNTGIHEISSHYEQDPERGYTLVVTYEGDYDALKADADNVRSQNGHAVVYLYEAPVYRMDVRYPSDDGYFDHWTRRTEYAPTDIRNSPKRILAAGTSETLNFWVKQILDAIDAGEGLTGTVDPAMQDLFDQMSRGVRSIEVERIVFRRRRIYPIGFSIARQPSPIPVIYTTDRMVFDFKVPDDIQGILPATPGSTPSGTRWGWKIRSDDLDLDSYDRKSEEVMDFAFAAWPTGDYDVLS